MGAVYAVGPSEVIMLVVGGLIVPSSSSVLFVSLLSTMASMACGAGALATPAVLWAVRQTDQIAPGSAQLGTSFSGAVAAFGRRDVELAEAPGKAR
jgi:hypothetical protein